MVKDRGKTEDFLLKFQRKPLPPEMKKKILHAANQNVAQMRPLMIRFRSIAAVCSALIVVVLLLDTKISENQHWRISSLQKTSLESEFLELIHDLTIILEPLDEVHELRDISWIKNRYFRERRTAKGPKKNREFNIFVEDFNGN